MKIRFAHMNIIANDWRALADFYIAVFGCIKQNPERDISGEWIDRMTMIPQGHLRGAHLSLPGHENPPTLEILEFTPSQSDNERYAINHHGFRHIAFQVDDIEQVILRFVEHGGSKFGDLVGQEFPGYGFFRGIYMRDPEENIVELQNWKIY